jgi:hypothetical protein
VIWLVGCLAFDEATEIGLVPNAPELPAERPDLEPFRGRWAEVTGEGEAASAVPSCPGGPDPAFVEVRGDGHTGWELVSGGPDGLSILPLTGAAPGPEGATLSLEGAAQVQLVWVEAGRIASFPALHGERRFAAPGAAGLVERGCP